MAAAGAARLEPMVHRREVAPEETATKSGMICAGRQTNASILLGPGRDLAAARAVLDHLEADRAGEWVLGPAGLSVEAGEPKGEGPHVWVVRDGEDFEVRGQLRNNVAVATTIAAFFVAFSFAAAAAPATAASAAATVAEGKFTF